MEEQTKDKDSNKEEVTDQNGAPDQNTLAETDAWTYNKKKVEKHPRYFPGKDLQEARVSADRDDLYYKMDHPRRGVALVFNHVKFTKLGERKGSHFDRDRIVTVLDNLGFETRVYEDLKYMEVLDTLDKVSLEDHSDADCLVIVIMTHGHKGVLYAYDNPYPVDLLWNTVTGDKCPSLAGKPKLVFIQACRGEEADDGVALKSKTATDSFASPGVGYTIPAKADLLVMYSTFAGHTSFRIPATGSWFIQALCTELEDRVINTMNVRYTLLDILTFVTRRVAIDYISYVQDENFDKKKQVPSIVSHLTRLVFFEKYYKKPKELE